MSTLRLVHAEPRTGGEYVTQHVAIVLGRQRDLSMRDAALAQLGAGLIGGLDDREAVAVILEMPLDQRQGAPADGAETDHDDGTPDAGMDGVIGHDAGLPERWRADRGSGGRREWPNCAGVWGGWQHLQSTPTKKGRPTGSPWILH